MQTRGKAACSPDGARARQPPRQTARSPPSPAPHQAPRSSLMAASHRHWKRSDERRRGPGRPPGCTPSAVQPHAPPGTQLRASPAQQSRNRGRCEPGKPAATRVARHADQPSSPGCGPAARATTAASKSRAGRHPWAFCCGGLWHLNFLVRAHTRVHTHTHVVLMDVNMRSDFHVQQEACSVRSGGNSRPV